MPLEFVTTVQVPGRWVVQHRDGYVVEGDITIGAHAISAGRMNSRQQRQGSDVSTRKVHHRQTGLGRGSTRLTGCFHPASQALQDVVIAGFFDPRASHSKAGERNTDDLLVDVLEVVVGDLELGRNIAAQVRIDHIRDFDQVFKHCSAFSGIQIQRERTLVAVERFEKERVFAFGIRRHVTPNIALDRRVFDLDDIGAKVCQVHSPPWPSTVLLNGDDAHVFKWLH